jgi:F-type H+-transporting ATPase subunit b
MEPDHAPVAHAPEPAALPALDLGFWKLDLADPAFWAFVGLIIFLFLAIFVMKAPKSVTKSLDDRAAKITAELAAAEALRKEAEAKLEAVKKRQAEAEQEAVDIVAAAHREAQQIAETAAAQLVERIARREKLAEERIQRAEADARRDVKLAAIDAASKAAAAILTDQLAGKAADDEFAKSLAAAAKALS